MTDCIASEQLGRQYDMDSDEFKASLNRRHHIGRQIPERLNRHDCDLIAVPSIDTSANVGTLGILSGTDTNSTTKKQRAGSDRTKRFVWDLSFFAKFCADHSLSFGILFVGRRFDDFRLIAAAHAFEQATQARRLVKPLIYSDIEINSPRLDSTIKPAL